MISQAGKTSRSERAVTGAAPLLATVAAIVAAALSVAASSAPATAAEAPAISPDRCAANKAAGPITFLTSFAYAASAGILDVLAAKKLGYFDALCLDVTIQPGSTNTQLVSAGTAQIAGVGGASDVMVAIDNGAQIEGIATYGNVGAIELITMADSGIKELKDFVGKTVGYKGAVAPQFSAMFLDNGVDANAINWVSVGYDPIILPNGNVQGLGAYKSNEPRGLEAMGYKITEWDPDTYGIHSTFNTQIVNTDWAKKHPTAVEDFLRASFHAFDWISASGANLDEALAYAASLSDAGYDIAKSKVRFGVEQELIAKTQPADTGVGWQDAKQWQPEADALVRFKLVKTAPDIGAAQNDSYVNAIYKGKTLIWPAP
ncbi:MAG: ABC transporter substrate-binding protein [Devosia sp.]|nr:ABC transporter substrate-binding protein [Devosia sp.]